MSRQHSFRKVARGLVCVVLLLPACGNLAPTEDPVPRSCSKVTHVALTSTATSDAGLVPFARADVCVDAMCFTVFGGGGVVCSKELQCQRLDSQTVRVDGVYGSTTCSIEVFDESGTAVYSLEVPPSSGVHFGCFVATCTFEFPFETVT